MNACFNGVVDEYGLADSVIVDITPSSTCELGTVWAGLEETDPVNH